MWKKDYIKIPENSNTRKILVTAAFVAVYVFTNRYLRIALPGLTHVDIRPQIVLFFIAGYLFGPLYGFIAGFAGNFCTDIILGYGLRYLPSWTSGNGLIGVLISLYPYRKYTRLDRISQLVLLVIFLIFVSIVSLAYAAGMENILNKNIPSSLNFRYFYLPALLSNVLSVLVLFPVILLCLGRLKMNYPIKLALAIYYLILILLIVFWVAFLPTYLSVNAILNSSGMSIAQGNALVDLFNKWSLLLVVFLIMSFFVSSWMSKTIVSPLKRLEEAVYSVLKGDPSSSEKLDVFSKREDEIGIMSYTVKLLSEKLWETQKLFQDELEKNMTFMDSRDSGTDIFVTDLITLYGMEALQDQKDDVIPGLTGELNNMSAISLLISTIGLKELAATYTQAKIQKSFEGMDSNIKDAALTDEERQSLALAIDMNLLFRGRLKVIDVHGLLSREMAFHLLERVHIFKKSSKNYVGYVTEPDIIGKISEKWDSSANVRSEGLEHVMNKAVILFLITGYQIKNLSDLANFDVNLKISYSHSNFKHIKQLIGLLLSETLQAKLQLEPKRSSFHYLDEWEKTPDLNLEILGDGRVVTHKDEFDMVMEFTTQEHRDRFRQIIEANAKHEVIDKHNVLFESWYHPLYRSDVPIEGYIRTGEITIRDKDHIVYTYVKEEEALSKAEWFKKEFQDLEISTSVIWVNDTFFRYLIGDRD